MSNVPMTELRLRPTVIAGETAPNDYCVWCGPDSVGRIMIRNGNPKHTPPWEWHVNPPFPIPPDCNGTAEDLEGAKVQFKAAWLRFRASISDEQWEGTMARQRRP